MAVSAAAMSHPDEIGDRVRRKRLELNMTRPDLAAKTGLSIDTIERYENGRVREPHEHNVILLATALGVSALWLLEGVSAVD